jgi:mono/diheme cytochrome c family protein
MPATTVLSPASTGFRTANRVALVYCLLGSLGSSIAAQTDPGPEITGQKIYESACVACHGGDGRGAPQAQVGFEDPLPDFSDCSFASREPAQDWELVVREGGPARRFSRVMPAFGQSLSREQITQVVAYVQSFCTDASWPRGELNLPRALATEKAFLEDEAVLEAAWVTRRGERSVAGTVIYEKRIGARAQWEVALPVVSRERPGAAGGGFTGFELGDVALGLKRSMYHSSSAIVSLAAEVKIPSGDVETGLGSGTFLVEPSVLAGFALPANAFVQLQGGIELPANRSRAEREVFWRGAVGTTFAADVRAISPMIEIEGARELIRGAPIEWAVIPQVQIALSRRQHILANIGLRLPVGSGASRGDRPRELVAYILWDWFDGGLLAGW